MTGMTVNDVADAGGVLLFLLAAFVAVAVLEDLLAEYLIARSRDRDTDSKTKKTDGENHK